MIIKDIFGDGKPEYETGTAISIGSESGQFWYDVKLRADGRLEIRAHHPTLNSDGKIMSEQLEMRPVNANFILISRPPE